MAVYGTQLKAALDQQLLQGAHIRPLGSDAQGPAAWLCVADIDPARIGVGQGARIVIDLARTIVAAGEAAPRRARAPAQPAGGGARSAVGLRASDADRALA